MIQIACGLKLGDFFQLANNIKKEVENQMSSKKSERSNKISVSKKQASASTSSSSSQPNKSVSQESEDIDQIKDDPVQNDNQEDGGEEEVEEVFYADNTLTFFKIGKFIFIIDFFLQFKPTFKFEIL